MPLRFLAFSVACALLLALSAQAQARTIHIVAPGDSMTYGWLVERSEAYPAQLQAALRKRGYDVVVDNAGVPGGTLADALKRFDAAIAPGTDIAVVEFGTNDLRQGASVQTVRARLTELIRSLRARKIEVLVVGFNSLVLADAARATTSPTRSGICRRESIGRATAPITTPGVTPSWSGACCRRSRH